MVHFVLCESGFLITLITRFSCFFVLFQFFVSLTWQWDGFQKKIDQTTGNVLSIPNATTFVFIFLCICGLSHFHTMCYNIFLFLFGDWAVGSHTIHSLSCDVNVVRQKWRISLSVLIRSTDKGEKCERQCLVEQWRVSTWRRSRGSGEKETSVSVGTRALLLWHPCITRASPAPWPKTRQK